MYPDQKKLKQIKRSTLRSVKKYIWLLSDYLKKNPYILYRLPVNIICKFLERHNTFYLTYYGAMMSTRDWLDVSIANVLRPKYEEIKGLWRLFHKKYLQFPEDICHLIADFSSSISLDGKSFAEFFASREFGRNVDVSSSIIETEGISKIYYLVGLN